MPDPRSGLTVMQEDTAVYGGLPLRLSFHPDAIREHFEDDGTGTAAKVAAATDADLAAAAADAVADDELYELFHELLTDAVSRLPDRHR